MKKTPNSVEEMGFQEKDSESVIQLLESLSELASNIREIDTPLTIFPIRIGVNGIDTHFETIEDLNRTIFALSINIEGLVWKKIDRSKTRSEKKKSFLEKLIRWEQ